MRILITADPEVPVPPELYGGIERIVDRLIQELRGNGHTVGLVAHHDSSVQVDFFCPWPGRRSQHWRDTLFNMRALQSAVKRFRPDVLHSFSRLMYMLPLFGYRLPKIMSYQRQPGRKQVAWASKLTRGTLQFTGCSEYICREGRIAGGVWHPIHNCVPLDRFTFQPSVEQDAPLVFLSRIERVKGAQLAIEIAKNCGKRLLIAGNFSENGPEGVYWKREILPYLGSDGIEYVGVVNDEQKNELLGKAAAMVVPIQWEEPFGIVFAEALACGTPVISSPRGALPEIVRNGLEGFLVNSVDEGCKAVSRINTLSRQACRQRAEALFSSIEICKRYVSLYQHMWVRQPKTL